jgi:hypothetical protein
MLPVEPLFCKRSALIGAAALCSACGTFVSRIAGSLPEAERVAVHCYWRSHFVCIGECHVTAVDVGRPGALRFANVTTGLAPGHRSVEFGIDRHAGGGGGTTDVCAFEHDLVAGHTFKAAPAGCGGVQRPCIRRPSTWRRQPPRARPASIAPNSRAVRADPCAGRPRLRPAPHIVCHPRAGHPCGTSGFRRGAARNALRPRRVRA